MALAVKRLGVAQLGGSGVGSKQAGELFLAAPQPHPSRLRLHGLSPPHFSPFSFVAVQTLVYNVSIRIVLLASDFVGVIASKRRERLLSAEVAAQPLRGRSVPNVTVPRQ
jgi:hypothetical protein